MFDGKTPIIENRINLQPFFEIFKRYVEPFGKISSEDKESMRKYEKWSFIDKFK